MNLVSKTTTSPLGQIVTLFLKLGFIGFGGPAAHIAMMEEEVVTRRQWLTRQQFLDLVGATNLIPGPNSTEMVIHIGYLRAGWPGLILAGVCFILPAVLITTFFAWLYLRFGSLPQLAPFLAGVKPAVLAVILGAVWKLGQTAAKNRKLLVIGLLVAAAALLGLNEIVALFAGGIVGMIWLHGWFRPGHPFLLLPPLLPITLPLTLAATPTLGQVALFFLVIGSVLYGSGYVLIAFLNGWLVDNLGWLSQQQLLDAVAVGQFTPGPLLTTATFIGYLLHGPAGALTATVAVFFPSFVFVVILQALLPRLRRSPALSAFLDAVNASSVGLMAAVLVGLGQTTLTNWGTWLIALVAAALALRWKISPPWLVAGGAVAGWFLFGLF